MKDIFACICIHLSIRFPGSRLSSTNPALHKWIMVVMMMVTMMVVMLCPFTFALASSPFSLPS